MGLILLKFIIKTLGLILALAGGIYYALPDTRLKNTFIKSTIIFSIAIMAGIFLMTKDF